MCFATNSLLIMKKLVAYILVIAGCIVMCYIVSTFGLRLKGAEQADPWALTIGIVIVAAIMALVRRIALWLERRNRRGEKEQEQQRPNDPLQ